jgi:hypothetical protein
MTQTGWRTPSKVRINTPGFDLKRLIAKGFGTPRPPEKDEVASLTFLSRNSCSFTRTAHNGGAGRGRQRCFLGSVLIASRWMHLLENFGTGRSNPRSVTSPRSSNRGNTDWCSADRQARHEAWCVAPGTPACVPGGKPDASTHLTRNPRPNVGRARFEPLGCRRVTEAHKFGSETAIGRTYAQANLLRTTFLAVTGFAVLYLNAANAETALCGTPSSSSAIVKDQRGYVLRLTVMNNGRRTVLLEPYYFEVNMLSLHAVVRDGHRELTPSIPIVSPGVQPLRLLPGKRTVRDISLATVFPELSSALRSSKVDVSWTLKLAPPDDCFSSSSTTTITIKRSVAGEGDR